LDPKWPLKKLPSQVGHKHKINCLKSRQLGSKMAAQKTISKPMKRNFV